ncbi:hypothetical protein ACK334_04620 [Aeromonas veronii]
MKYKRIPAALHNFGHSFMSLMNYVEDSYVCDAVFARLKAVAPAPVVIPFQGDLPFGLPKSVAKSIRYYREWLPNHLREEGLDPAAIENITLIVEATATGPAVFVTAVDDRGKGYRVRVAA